MKEVVVISGKGGTGKTSLTASFAMLQGKNLVVADCDVDADDMHLLLNPKQKNSKEFYSGLEATIDYSKCINCGKCYKVCRFSAINFIKKNDKKIYQIDKIDCEGCGYCFEVCPNKAIKLEDANVGKIFTSEIKTNTTMINARLNAGADNSGKLVAEVKQLAKNEAEKLDVDLILIDGSPGIGCPVVSSITGADYVILVTEPTKSGFHDLERVYKLIKKFKIKAGIIINKYDINIEISKEIEEFTKKEKISLIGKLPYSQEFTKAMTQGKTVVENEKSEIKTQVQKIWEKAKKEIFKE